MLIEVVFCHFLQDFVVPNSWGIGKTIPISSYLVQRSWICSCISEYWIIWWLHEKWLASTLRQILFALQECLLSIRKPKLPDFTIIVEESVCSSSGNREDKHLAQSCWCRGIPCQGFQIWIHTSNDHDSGFELQFTWSSIFIAICGSAWDCATPPELQPHSVAWCHPKSSSHYTHSQRSAHTYLSSSLAMNLLLSKESLCPTALPLALT